MKFRHILFLVVFLISLPGFIRAQDILWSRTYGGSNNDHGFSVQQTTDGGYIVVGFTNSFAEEGEDVYLIKTDSLGDTLWSRTYGGSDRDYGYSVQQTTDGGYIVTGYTQSFGTGFWNVYLIKTDSLGDTLWSRTYGGSSHNYGISVQQTTDGGYVVTGWTEPHGDDYDVYLIKTDSLGDTLWSRTYGGSYFGYAYSVQQTTDGGYIVTGTTRSFGAGYYDVYLIKTDSFGDTLWSRTYGGSSDDAGYSVQQTTDGGYIVAGDTRSFGAGFWHFYLIKTDSLGDTLWSRTYGGSNNDYGRSVQQTTDGGYIVTGYTESFGTGFWDFYLIKTDSLGDTLWSRIYGGSSRDWGTSVQQTTDGGYIVAGATESFGAGSFDVTLAKLDSLGNACIGEFVTSTVSSPSCSITAPPTVVTSPSLVITSPPTQVTSPPAQLTTVCEYLPHFPTVIAPDSSKFLCMPDTIRFTVTATDPNPGDTLNLSGPGIPVPIKGVSPLMAYIKIYVSSAGTYNYVYTVTDTLNDSDIDTATWIITINGAPMVDASDSSVFLCNPDTIQFGVTATDPDPGDTITLSGPGITTPVTGFSPVHADVKLYIPSAGTYDYIYQATDKCGFTDQDTATCIVTLNSPPDSFSLLSPADNDVIPCPVTFDWVISSDLNPGDTVRYDLHVSSSCVFHPDSTVIYDSLLTNQCTDTLEIKRCYWKVMAYDACHAEIWSNQTWTFVTFIRGDTGGDWVIDINDVIYLINYVFRRDSAPVPLQAGDVNCDSLVNIVDAVYLINYLFKEGPPPC